MTDKLEKIKILYEDADLLVIDKPEGLVVNRSKTHTGLTVQDWIDEKYDFKTKYDFKENEEFIERSGLAHRLDKDTSGVLVIAKTPSALTEILRQFRERETSKYYLALAHGKFEEEIFEINAPIGRNPKKFMKFAVVSSGKDAFTRIEKLKELEKDGKVYTLLKVSPKTGRTHQIRVHLSALGKHIAGDPIYCPSNLLKMDEEVFGRMMLHAQKISFSHPITHESISVETKKPPLFEL